MRKEYVNLTAYPVAPVLEILLRDRTTGNHSIFAANDYRDAGYDIGETDEITPEVLSLLGENEIQPRVAKSKADQASRTKAMAEVFTPSWICNKMNNYCDDEWFGYEGSFNTEQGQSWLVKSGTVVFPPGKTWQDYVLSKRLEITCGEAPYLVSRYDTTTGDFFATERRIGLLDRKLRVITEQVTDEKEWCKWVYAAYQSVYGYEFQGDNLLIARINLLNTFCDYYESVWRKKATVPQLKTVAEIISWNLWQMDGLKGCVPFREPAPDAEQMTLFGFAEENPPDERNDTPSECVIKDWEQNETVIFNKLKRG
ncbi:MAG TPA: restriction endonuclease subunit M [Ruminococcaceae bacterium]|nr:restriction endonuclease subunit M [Oscillospiraceae bacterium]